ncbi:MAG TPA: autotransporter-associated beta strand repeat-containing protein [Verrucomicrobiae bacterium]|nr:autotransporter-associated beta strand repeat-containing protein [Verrucomicrobiae bacterium]
MKNSIARSLRIAAVLAICLMSVSLPAALVTKADNTNELGSASSWVGGVAPTSTDVATWSGTYSASENNTTGLTNSLRTIWSGSALAWQGIRVETLSGTALTTNTFYAGTSGFGAETNIQAATQSGNIVTITTRAAHGFVPGMTVTIAGVTPAGYNGTFTVLGVPGGTTFTYSTDPGLAAGTSFGTVEAAMYIGGTGTAVVGNSLTIGSAGIDLSAASHSAVISVNNAGDGFMFAGNQTWNIAAGRNLRLGGGGISAASAKTSTSGSDGLIDISGGGVVDANQGGGTGFADVGGFTGFTGKWRVNSGATLRGLRNGATAWGSNADADCITLNGGTLAVGGMSGAVGNWTWTSGITLAPGTTSSIDDQNVAGTGRSLLLNGPITGSGHLIFKQPLVSATSFTSPDFGFILTGANDMSGTVTIGGPLENGVPGRLSFVRVGGVGGLSTSTGIGGSGSLGTAIITNNGVLTFSLNTALTVNTIHGTGLMRVGYTAAAGAENQNISLTGVNTYSGDTRINMGTLTLPAGASIPNTPNIFLTPLTAASFIAVTLDVTGAGGLTLSSGQRLVGGANNAGQNNIAQVNGNVTAGNGSAIVPGGTNVVNTLAINGDLTLTGGATLVLDVNNSAGDSLTVGNLNVSGITTLLITPPPGGLFAGDYTLITSFGTLGGSPANFSLVGLSSAGRGQTFNVVYDGGSVKLRVTGSPAELIWRGDGVANVWDNSITTNWINAGNPDAFFPGDYVTLDDTGSNTPPVALVGALQANLITVSAANDYTFAGSGRLTGSGILSNLGPGTLTIVTSNDYVGKVALVGGTLSLTNETALGANPSAFAADQLLIDNATLSVGAPATFRNLNRGITLGANGGTLSHGANAITISNVVAGAGTLTKDGSGTLTMAGSNTYTGGTIVSDGKVTYASRAALGRGANTSGTSGFFAKPFTLRQGIVDLNGQFSYDPNFAGGTAAIGVPVMLYDGSLVFGGTGGAGMTFQDTAASPMAWGSGFTTPATLIYDASGDPGTATIQARFAGAGTSGVQTRSFDVGDSTATAVEVDITGTLGVTVVNSTNQDGRNVTLVKDGPGTLRVSAPNHFPGWLVNNGTLLVNHVQALGTDRTMAIGIPSAPGFGSSNLLTVVGGMVDLNGFSPAIGGINDNGSSAGTIRNNGGAASTLTVGLSDTNAVMASYSGVIENGSGGVALVKSGPGTQTLGGPNTYTGGTTVSNGTLLINGSITGGATVRSGGTLGGTGTVPGVVAVEAGGTLTAGDGIGTLTLGSSPVLNGAVRAEVDRNDGALLADLISVTGNPIAYNGTLAITNAGAPLQPGDTFTLFNASGYSGGFSIVSQTPGQSVTWNTANLTVNGTISVASVGPAVGPELVHVVNGNQYQISWPAEFLGWQLQVQTNALSVGLGDNWFAVPGSTDVTAVSIPIDPANPAVFLRLVYPPQP